MTHKTSDVDGQPPGNSRDSVARTGNSVARVPLRWATPVATGRGVPDLDEREVDPIDPYAANLDPYAAADAWRDDTPLDD
jgi:hypothetical protein